MTTSIVIGVVLVTVGLTFGWTIRWLYARFHLSACEQRAERILQEAQKEAESKKKSILLEAKEYVLRERNQQERDDRDRRAELQRAERRLLQKEEALSTRAGELDSRERSLKQRDQSLCQEEARYRQELERVSGLTQNQARDLIIKNLENEAKHDAQALINKIEEDAALNAERRARDILVTTMQRITADVTGDVTVSTVNLPSEEMKGRIIGREGRNIRALETLTGADVVVDDTPEAVVISCFDPVRKEIARISLERLVLDGRIHPARIEEIVQKVTQEVSQKIYEEGEKVLFDLGIHDMCPEGVRALGRLYFRTSYGQNVLYHSKEVALLASMLASEIGADVAIAKRGALLHDIGKGVETDSDRNHAEIGMEMARKMNEDPRVVNAVGSHHNDIEPCCVESWLVQVADAISAARPGARSEMVDHYVKRLENLEAIAEGFSGVEKAYAIQAGRELRVLVNNDKIPDRDVKALGRDIAKKIESDLKYPGRIRVTLIRETRVVEYAR